MVFVFGSVYVVNYVDRLAYVEPALHPWGETDLIAIDKLLMCYWIWFARIFLMIFASMFIRDIGLKFSFLVVFLPGFAIRMMLVF